MYTYFEMQSTVDSIAYELPIRIHVMYENNKCLEVPTI